ncbi:MAG TPA: serine O-acetyltransferase EpsC [Actinophytocola sp.]|uniref:serine O-acetyltransferase EpsC n=1 Tax=Actinophytocola sp. TaxID=1872138 RepID=UPI002DBC81E6|nr:serine O-acetyltransferase EpsC [Actinophytocola sp.]HEU5472608.1 serine O-acetyltransferase EpsC [Actinophytocola sp.]
MSILRLYRAAAADLDMIRERDPSITSRREALLHPGLLAIWAYRIAHRLHTKGMRLTARLLSVLARLLTGGIEIHPGARIGRGFFIDHGAGVVIGETAVIGADVTIFHQVTLGSVGWWHDARRPEGTRRHPKVGDRVVIGANATVLGPVTVGPDSVIGAQALVIRDVPPGSRVLAPIADPHRIKPKPVPRPEPVRQRYMTASRDRDAVPAGFPTW